MTLSQIIRADAELFTDLTCEVKVFDEIESRLIVTLMNYSEIVEAYSIDSDGSFVWAED